jgi:hypothetical protein
MPARPITLGNLHVCKDRRVNASGFNRLFVAALGADLRMKNDLPTCSDAICSNAVAIMNSEKFEKAGHLPAMGFQKISGI